MHKTVAELLRDLGDARELTEWMAYLSGESEIDSLVYGENKTDPALARQMVWGRPKGK